MTPPQAYAAVRHALVAGYRHVDTAQFYGNEAEVGRAVRDSGVPRDEVFITTKLWNEHQREGRVEPAFDTSVQALGLGPPDLFLLHWPVQQQRLAAWKVLERLHREGRVRAIGVSNFMVSHLSELLEHAVVVPAVNQIELSPFLQQRAVRDLCARHGIVVEAYSPLTKGERLNHRVLTRIAHRLGRSNAQVMLRWGLQRGVVVLPKSVHPDRIASNLDLWSFDLGFADLAALDALEENLVTGWNPQRV
jgi:diketogulonate reductase-like aldo/keto reductase